MSAIRLYSKSLLPILFVIFFSQESRGQDLIILKEFLDEAKANNPELKAFDELVKARQARAKAEGALDDPMLKIELEDLDKKKPLNISPDDSMLTRYTLSQTLPFWGKLSLREDIALKEVEVEVAKKRARELEIMYSVKEAYFDYAFLNESTNIVEEIKRLLSRTLSIAETKYSLGEVSQQDVIRIQVEMSLLANELIVISTEKEISKARLKSLINVPQDSFIKEPAPLSKERVAFDTEGLIDAATTENPGIKMLEFEIEALEMNVELAKKTYYPDFMIGVAPIQRDGRFDSFDLMFQMNIPLWRSRYDNIKEESILNTQSARARRLNVRNEKSLEIKEALLGVSSTEKTLTLYETGLVPLSELSFESAIKNYQSGMADLLSLLDAERELKRVRLEYLETLMKYHKRIAMLEKITGKDIRG